MKSKEHDSDHTRDFLSGFSGLIEALPMGLVVTKPDGSIIEGNSMVVKILGYNNKAEMLRSNANLHYLKREDRIAQLERLEKSKFNDEIARFKRIDGSEFYSRVLAYQETNEAGEIIYFNILEDITESVLVKKELKKTESRLKEAQTVANIGYWELNNVTNELFWADQVYKIFGIDHQSFEQSLENFLHHVHPEDRDMVNKEFAKSVKNKTDYDVFHRIIRPDGEIRFVHETGKTIFENNEAITTFGMIQDVTKIKRIEADLNYQQKFSDTLIDMAPIYYVAIDKDGNTIMMNQMLLNKLGYTESEVVGKNYNENFVPERDRELLSKIFDELMGTKSSTINENHIISKNGEEYLVEWRGTQIFDENGNFDYFLGLGIDISARKNAEQRIKDNVKRLNAMREIDRAITLSVDLFFTMNMIVDQVAILLNVDAVAVLTLDKDLNELSFAAMTGFKNVSLEDMSPIKLYDSYAGQAVVNREVIQFTEIPYDYEDKSFINMLEQEKFINYYGLPLITKGEVMGVLEIYHRSQLELSDDWIDAMNDFAGQTAIALDHSKLFGELTRTNFELSMAYDSTLEGWALALELRDEETQGHSLRVTKQTLRLAEKMGVERRELVHIRRGALLHDIGKMGIPDNILLKPGKLDNEEWKIMRTHPVIAYDLLARTPFLKEALDIPYYHHEKWDGSGYPQGTKGTEIPLAARIFAIIDNWDALLSDRPYGKAWTVERVSDYIKSQSGLHFDPEIAEVFLELIKTDKIFTEDHEQK